MDLASLNAAARRIPIPVVWAAGLVPLAWLAWNLLRAAQGETSALGVDPVKALEHALGRHALQFLIAGLAITPLRRLTGLNLVRLRRPLGLLAFTYLVAHLAVWAILDVQIPAQMIEDLTTRTYIILGLAGFVMLLPLAVTSTDSWVRRLGPARWRSLHKLVYPAVVLGAIHFLMSVKGMPPEPLVYLGLVAGLLLLRLVPRRRISG